MASNQKSSLGDSSIPAVPFSYAQAAKGISSSHASAQSSRVASGAITPVTPARENSITPFLKSEMAPGTSWADDVESGSKGKEKESHSSATTVVDAQQSPATTSPMIHPAHSQPNGVASPPSPDFGSSSTSTLAREDDTSSVPISSSDSTWENKSQGSHVPEKRQLSSDRAPSKGRKNNRSKKLEKNEEQEKDWSQPALPLHEAPIPVVNPWKIRAETKVVPKPAPISIRPYPATAESKPANNKEAVVTITTNVDAAKLDRHKAASTATLANADATRTASESAASRKEGDDRSNQRREPRTGAKGSERIEKGNSVSPAPKVTSPPMDQESWPTPDTVTERSHDKTEKPQKALVEATPAQAPKGKSAWEKVDFTPTVVFSTPLPGNARRGGRGGGRGGRESGGRQSSGTSGEKGSTSQPALTNGESARRGRPENSAQGSSPSKGKRASSSEPVSKRDLPTRTLKEVRPADANAASELRTQKASGAEEESKHNSSSQDNMLQRNGNPLRPKTNRRNEAPVTNGEKRKEGEAGGKENDSIAASRRTSISNAPTGTASKKCSRAKVTNTFTENGDRKYSPPTDPVTGSRYSPSERRSGNFGSFSSRDRPEGGHRGGRGGSRGGRNGTHAYHQNSQPAYPNAQIQGASGYSLPRSPTGYQQEPYFGHQPTHSRSFRGGPGRAQSIPVENYRGFSNGYGPNALPQLNTFVGQNGIYDYSNMMTMSATPYAQAPYVDPYALLPMVTQQM
jgi:la-related protein 1